MKKLILYLLCWPLLASGSTLQMLKNGVQLCVDPGNTYRHRLLVTPVALDGAIPVAWRGIDLAIDELMVSHLIGHTRMDVRYLRGLRVAGLDARSQRQAVRTLGQQNVAQFAVVPTLQRPRHVEPESRDVGQRAADWLKTQFSSRAPVELPLQLDIYDLRRGTIVSSEQMVIATDLPKRQSVQRFEFSQEIQQAVRDFSEVLAAQIACQPISVPIISARGMDVELRGGADLGLQPGDVMDLELVKSYQYGTEYGYSTRPIKAKITVTQVLPERSVATLTQNAEVINLQPGDLALAR